MYMSKNAPAKSNANKDPSPSIIPFNKPPHPAPQEKRGDKNCFLEVGEGGRRGQEEEENSLLLNPSPSFSTLGGC